MRRFLRPGYIWALTRNSCAIVRGGGPAEVRLNGISEPEGLLVPASSARFEIKARDGRPVNLEAPLPMPFSLALAWRLGRAANVPVVSAIQPERIRASVRVPGTQASAV